MVSVAAKTILVFIFLVQECTSKSLDFYRFQQFETSLLKRISIFVKNILLSKESNPPVIVGPDEGSRFSVLTYGNSERIIKLRGNETGGRFMIMEGRILPGEGPPIHIHTREDESFHVLEGELEFQIGDQFITAKAGQWIYAPIGLKHTFRNINSTDARLEFVFTPAGIERYFEEISQVLARKPTNWSEIANQVAKKYGIDMLGIPNWNG